MAVELLTGKPGAGKSYRATVLIIDELGYGKRSICTNVPISPRAIADYLRGKHGEDYGAMQRIRILTPEECMAFWLFPAPNCDHDVSSRVAWKSPEGRVLKVPDFSDRKAHNPHGTYYAIDEVHNFFSARSWQQNSDEGWWYLTQHRKYDDEILFITQNVEYVDKRMRGTVERFTYTRNRTNTNMPFLGGLFRGIPGFSLATYPEPYRLGLEAVETQHGTKDGGG